MNRNDLLELIVLWENLQLILTDIKTNPENFGLLAEIALYSNHPKSWRAAWLIDKIHDKSPELVRPIIPAIIRQIKIEQDAGKKRHFIKIISLNPIPVEEQGWLFDYCVKTLTSDKEPISVRVHAMQTLYNITENAPGLKPEVLGLIELEMETHPTGGILSRGIKLAKKLRKQTRNLSVG